MFKNILAGNKKYISNLLNFKVIKNKKVMSFIFVILKYIIYGRKIVIQLK